MAKERSEEKKDKKEKKSTKASDDGVKKSKKDKKDKKSRKSDVDVSMADGDDTEVADVTNALSEALEGDKTEVDGDLSVVKTSADVEINGVNKEQLLAAMVPFANPMADEKSMKKVLKGVKKAAKHKTLKRGVKEVVKSLRKSSTTVTASAQAPAVVVLAADISPFDVISHIPVLCEDHNVPYIYVPSRAELGTAGSTKRPTSVVMITPGAAGGKGKEVEGADEWKEMYADLVKVVEKAQKSVRV